LLQKRAVRTDKRNRQQDEGGKDRFPYLHDGTSTICDSAYGSNCHFSLVTA
jgi:hypothetical protein